MDFLPRLRLWPEAVGPLHLPRPSSDPRPSGKRIWKYDVFISFRGPDTRNSFTNHLYDHLTRKGIFTFKDDKKLEKGQPISSQLLQAIKDSRVSIVVFSKDYASSSWCLEEMATIADCQRDLKQTVFSVFYHLEPSVVRYQAGVYKKAFSRRKNRNGASKVNRWKTAMASLANDVGYTVTKEKPQVREIEKIVQDVIKSLDHKFSGHAEDLIGIQPRVHELENLLKLSSANDDFRVLGIWGMGGIGKTTLATVLYDRISYQFDASCFIEDVRKIYKDGDAIAVQKQILRQTLDEKNLETYGPSEISGIVRNRLRNIKVLVVLDNVDQWEQLEKLAIVPNLLFAGSRIIITTTNEHILKVYEADCVYKVPLLNNDDARELFCTKAFKSKVKRGKSFISRQDPMVNEIIEYTKGLPLAIRAMGSFLYGQDAFWWRDALDIRPGNNLEDQIMNVLRISFEGLKYLEKEIFLHIACFFNGEKEDYVKRILDCCGLCPHSRIPVIIEKSLITIRNQEIHMHEMLCELGKEVVWKKSPKDPESWSRLWLYKDFHHVLTSRMGTNQTNAIVMDQKEDVSKYGQLQVGELSKMRGLELLILYEMNCTGGLSLPNSLYFLSWHGCPFTCLPSDFQPYKLVELNMSNSKIIQLWEGIKDLPSLKRMDLSNSINLMETPNFEGIPNLQRLDLRGCENLTKVHPSIGLLENLAFLSLQNCSNLASLNVGSVSNLWSLRVLHLSGCTNLENTPDFSGMPNLEYLDLGQCTSLSTIHESIGALVNLKFLSFRGCTNLVKIPDSINAMGSLITLDLSNCSKLKNLPMRPRLKLEDCLASSRYLPSSSLGSLIFLDLDYCNMYEVPAAIGDLKCLERLNLQGNHFGSLPDTISLLCSLAYLNLSHCHELQSLPLLPSTNASLVGRYFETVSGAHYNFNRSGLYIFDCPNLVESKYSQACASKLALEWLTRLIEEPRHFRCGFDIVVPSRVIPEWFNHQFIGGSGIRIGHCDVDDNWIGAAFCVAFEVNNGQADFFSSHDSIFSLVLSPLYLSFESEYVEESLEMPHGFNWEQNVGSKHIWLIYISRTQCPLMQTGTRVTFKARPYLEIRRWGLRMIYKQGTVAMNRDLNYEEVYVHDETPTLLSSLKIQLPYNWMMTEEEEIETVKAKEKDIIGLGQPPLKDTPSSWRFG